MTTNTIINITIYNLHRRNKKYVPTTLNINVSEILLSPSYHLPFILADSDVSYYIRSFRSEYLLTTQDLQLLWRHISSNYNGTRMI